MTDRSRENSVVVPFQQSLITGLMLALLVAVAALGVRRWAGLAYGWVEVALLAAGSFALGFAALWCVMLWALRPERERPARVAPVAMDVSMPTIPLAFDARDARDFVQAALLRVNGAWQDRDGGASWRAMERKGWTRERWQQGVDWLVGAGLLRWRDPAEHRAGLEWDFAAVQRFLGL